MTKSHEVLFAPLFAAILGIAFCVWSALGNDVNFCVTTGCTLYQDFTLAGISLWWFGTAAFTALAICGALGRKLAGKRLAAFFLLGDIALLALMAFTAPCVSCLAAGLLFALCYFLFRRLPVNLPRPGETYVAGHSLLLWAWVFLFAINLGQVARSELDIWPILDESGDASTRMFFSVNCAYCREGIDALSGKVDVAFYPVAEKEDDVYRIATIMKLLNDGESMAEAFGQSAEFQTPKGLSGYTPEMLLLRFRLLRNKAHIFAAGSQTVPYFEQRGLPVDLAARSRQEKNASGPGRNHRPEARDYGLPSELTTVGQCGGETPCPPPEERQSPIHPEE